MYIYIYLHVQGPRKSRDNRIAAVIVGVGHGEP